MVGPSPVDSVAGWRSLIKEVRAEVVDGVGVQPTFLLLFIRHDLFDFHDSVERAGGSTSVSYPQVPHAKMDVFVLIGVVVMRNGRSMEEGEIGNFHSARFIFSISATFRIE